jgi:hypothetical protein
MDWSKDLKDAHLYARTAKGMKESRKVDNETLYNIICLSVEKYTATMAGMVNYIPMHSGLSFVMRELSKKMEVPQHFLEETRFLNGFMTYCSLDFEKPKEISESDLQRMVMFLNDLCSFVENKALTISSFKND